MRFCDLQTERLSLTLWIKNIFFCEIIYAYFTPGIWKLLRCLKSLEETNSQQPVNPRQLPVLNHPCGKTASSGKTPPNELNLILWLNILCEGVNTLILFKITED